MSNADFVPPARARDSDEKQTKLSPEQLHQLGLVHLNNGTLHGMTNALGSKNICAAAFWLSTVAGALIIQSVHMFFLLSSAVNSNTVTSIKYNPIQLVPLPQLTICGHPSKLLDSDKLVEANLRLSIALRFLSLYGLLEPIFPKLNDSIERQLYQEAFQLNGKLFSTSDNTSTNSEKISRFLLNFTIACNLLFTDCSQGYAGTGKVFHCCDVFKPVLTGLGICYAFDHHKWNKSRSAGAFSGLSFFLNHSRLRLDDPIYFHHFGDKSLSDVSMSVSNGIEQNPLTNNFVSIKAGDNTQVMVTSTKLEFLPGKGACVTNTELDFYQDYTINNCVWERSFYKSPRTPNCSIFFDLTKLGFNFVGAKGKKYFTTSDGSAFKECSPEDMRSSYLNMTHDYSRWVSIIDVPNRPDNCPFPCDYWEQSMSVMKNANSYDVRYPLSLVKVSLVNQNPLVMEFVSIEWKDYLCLAGGAMGLWTGSSIITIIQCSIGALTILLAFIWKSCQKLKTLQNVSDTTNLRRIVFVNNNGST